MEYDQRQQRYQDFKNVAYYVVIGIISFVSVVFLPFLQSMVDASIWWPSTPMEWAIWIASKVALSTINVVIFYSFIQQGKVNIKDDKVYLAALQEYNLTQKSKELLPRSPRKYNTITWSTKGVILFISSLASSIILGQALLKFDLVVFLTYAFAILLAVVFGYLQMRKTEEYWTTEFPAYVR